MREEFTKATKQAAWERCKGRCDECGNSITRGVQYDHIVPAWLGGAATLENCACLCTPCHSLKTAKHDVPAIAKTKRVLAKRIKAEAKNRRPMPGSKASGWKKPSTGSRHTG